MSRLVNHTPVWEPADLPIDAVGNTRPGFVCVHELENGNGRCGGNGFDLAEAIGDHCCVVDDVRDSDATTADLHAWLASAKDELDAMVLGAREALREGVTRRVLAPRLLAGVLQRVEDGYSDDLIGALVFAVLDQAERGDAR